MKSTPSASAAPIPREGRPPRSSRCREGPGARPVGYKTRPMYATLAELGGSILHNTAVQAFD